MGNLKKNLFTLLLLISLFFFLSSSTNEFHPKNVGSPSDYNKAPLSPNDDHIKNSEPFFLKKQTGELEEGLMTTKNKKTMKVLINKRNKKKKMKTGSLNLKREKSTDWSRKRTYTAMLPKGFVPPSGSSPCHNTYPNSVTFFCHLSTSPKIP